MPWRKRITKQPQILHRMLAPRRQPHIRTITHPGQGGGIPGMQGWRSVRKSTHAMQCITKRQENTRMLISTDAEGAFGKRHHAFRMDTLKQNEAAPENPQSASPLRPGTGQGCPLSPLPANRVLERLSQSHKAIQSNESDTDWEGRTQALPLCR